MKLINNKVYFAVQDYLMILLGTLLYGFGFNAFILSNEIITGGVSGICALIFFASNEIIPVSVSYFVKQFSEFFPCQPPCHSSNGF